MRPETFYRIVNLFYVLYVFPLGLHKKDTALVLSSVAVFLVDAGLLGGNIFDLRVLQPLRFLATLFLGPLWIYKGVQYNNILLLIFGLSFIIFDGTLFLQNLFQIEV